MADSGTAGEPKLRLWAVGGVREAKDKAEVKVGEPTLQTV